MRMADESHEHSLSRGDLPFGENPGDHTMGADLTRVKADVRDLDEALDLLALWHSRWQGFTAGTPNEMVTRTRGLLEAHGRPPQKVPVQHG